MERILAGTAVAIVLAVTGYELATGSAGYRIGFSRQKVTRAEQPLAYWAIVGIKLLAVGYIFWRLFLA